MADILITGGAGFIGSHMARRRVRAGADVHVIIRPGSEAARLHDIREQITVHEVDLADADALAACLARVSPRSVHHFAAVTRPPTDLSPVDSAVFAEQDVTNLFNLVRAMADAPRPPDAFIRAGTIAEYGISPTPYREDAREGPVTSYGAAMLAGTQHLHALKGRLPFPCLTARLALVYGPGQATSFFIPYVAERLVRGEPAVIQNPNDRRDLIHIDDVLDGFDRLEERMPLEADVLNLCTGVAPRMGDVAAIILRECGGEPHLLQTGEAGARGGAKNLVSCPETCARVIDWRARIRLEEGLARLVGDLRSERRGPPRA